MGTSTTTAWVALRRYNIDASDSILQFLSHMRLWNLAQTNSFFRHSSFTVVVAVIIIAML